MIVGIGLDITDITRINRVWQKYGRHFLAKFLTEAEIDCAQARGLSYIAGRFAAKEAAAKALGTGFARGIVATQIETINERAGAPLLFFHGHAARRAREIGVGRSFLSISHEKSMASAIVILED